MFQQNRNSSHSERYQYPLSSISTSSTHTNDQFKSCDELLSKYRKTKPNSNCFFKKDEKKQSFLPDILCRILMQDSQNLKARQMNSKCQCPKNEQGLCKLVMNWIDETYFWKTDPHFKRTYEHYARKKNEDWALDQIVERIESKLQILGLQLEKQEVLSVAQILLNYEKHAIYYGKQQIQLRQSDIYIWIGLGICYHVGFGPKNNHPQIVFWAIQIIVDKIGSLSKKSMAEQHHKFMKRIDYYFLKWNQFFSKKGISLSQIGWQWINQMMFGYMGIDSIGFFLDCFLKAGWNYLFKVCLSYLQHRINDIKRSTAFMTGQITKDQILTMILDSSEEWPMIFCTASSFNYKQQ